VTQYRSIVGKLSLHPILFDSILVLLLALYRDFFDNQQKTNRKSTSGCKTKQMVLELLTKLILIFILMARMQIGLVIL